VSQQVEELLREIVTELRALRGDLARERRLPASLSREDRMHLARMLPAIVGVYGSQEFSTRDLLEDAEPAVRLVMRGLSVKRASSLFSRAAGIPIDGLMIHKGRVELQVLAWTIVRVMVPE
jgi:hypothetical protein